MKTHHMLAALALGLACALPGRAAPPPLISYQGRLLDGTNLAQGAVALSLRLFNQAVDGDLLYEDTGTVAVVDGLYATLLGDGTATGDLVSALAQPEVFLEVAINGTALTPRERMASVPFALQAVEADPRWAAASNEYYQKAEADALFATKLQAYVENDALFTSSVAGAITATDTERWAMAFAWGDHATNGYLTSFAEADPRWTGASNLYYQRAEADALFATGTPVYAESDLIAGEAASNAWQAAVAADDSAALALGLASNALQLAADALPASASNGLVHRDGDVMTGSLRVPALVMRLTNLSEVTGWSHLEMWEESGRVSARIGIRHAWYDTNHYVLYFFNNAAITGSTWFADDPSLPASRMAIENNYNDGTRRVHEFNWDVDDAGGGINFRRVFNFYAYSDGLDNRAGASFFLHRTFFSTPEGLTNLIISAESDPGVAVSSWPYIRTAGDLGSAPHHGLVIGSGYGHLYLQHDLDLTNHVIAAVPPHNLVGIGTEEPTEKLTVSGNILATGRVTAASFAGDGAALTGLDAERLGGAAAGDYAQRIVVNGTTNAAIGGVVDLGALPGGPGAVTEVVRGEGSSDRLSVSNGLGPQVVLRFDADGLATGTPVYVETDASALLTNGTRAMAGDLNLGGHAITNLADDGLVFADGATAGQRFVDAAGDAMAGPLLLPAGGLQVGATQLVVLADGRVGIGTAAPTNALAVNGAIEAREVIVNVTNWPDYVFRPGYAPMPLAEVARYLDGHGHLPGLPSAREAERDGVPLGALGAALLQKVEELTLHQVELQRENERLRAEVERLAARLPAAP